MKEESKIQRIQHTPLNEISLHPEVPENLLSTIVSVSTNIFGQNMISKEALTCFLQFHPPHVVRDNEKNLLCFAGIRSYQLAKTFFDIETEIPTIIHYSVKDKEVRQRAPIEAILCQLIFGLDDRTWEIDMLRFWQTIEKDQLVSFMPGLQNKFSLAEKLGVDRRRYSMKLNSPESKLQKLAKRESDAGSRKI